MGYGISICVLVARLALDGGSVKTQRDGATVMALAWANECHFTVYLSPSLVLLKSVLFDSLRVLLLL